ncbi:MAG: MnhB domain-containing protein [Chthoniobacterales bacterium]
MNALARLILLFTGALGLALLMACAFLELPGFGKYPGPYGDMMNSLAPYERQVTNVVTAINFDYRGLDTLGEEFILFAAVSGLVLLLRGRQGESPNAPAAPSLDRKAEPSSDAVRWLSFGLIALINLFGTYMVVHGHLSPGGGFQGGAILGTASMLVYVAFGYRVYRKTTPKEWVEIVEAIGAGSYAVIGIGALLAGGAFLQNVLPLGTRENLFSGGTIPLINFAVGLEVAAGFALLFIEFLEETRAPEPDENE